MSKPLLWLIAATLPIIAFLIYDSSKPYKPEGIPYRAESRKAEPKDQEAVRPGSKSVDIGRQSENFGTSGQAQAMLKIMADHPGQGSYQITYATSLDTVVFGCDLNKDTIVRIHQLSNGTGTGERWQGNFMYRLKSASQGGSLNDTPVGKSPAVMQSF